jgi:lipopolysaccharide export LptBFGC system permease protein LptF
MMPGRTLHRLAARICSANTLERVVEPAIADFQKEYADAGLHSPLMRARVLLSGYAGVWEGIAMTALEMSPVETDRRALRRALLCAAAATVCTSALLIALTIAGTPVFAPFYIALLTPMTLPIALPIGLTLGIAFGLSQRRLSRSAKIVVLASALCATAVSFASMAYITPVANQAFRQSVFTAIGGRGVVTKGLHEMSLPELQREIRMAPRGDAAAIPERAEWIYQLTLALPLAPLVLAALALLLVSRGTQRAIVMVLSIAYYVVAFAMEALVYQGLPPLAAAWLPNIIFAAAAALIAFSGASRLHGSPSPAQ